MSTPSPTSAPASRPAIKPLPPKTSEVITASFKFPNVLKETDSQSGRDILTVINGGNQQVSLLVETWLSETLVAPPPLFIIQSQNQIRFGGQMISVINDAVTYNGKSLTATAPTAAQYFAQVGKQVFLSFSCAPVSPQSAVFATHQRAALFAVKQTSMILP